MVTENNEGETIDTTAEFVYELLNEHSEKAENQLEFLIDKTSEIANESEEDLPTGNAIEEKILSEKSKQEEGERKRGVKAGTKRGAYTKTGKTGNTVTKEPLSNKEDQKGFETIINSVLIAPVASFMVDDVSAAMIQPNQAEFLNKLMPETEFKPSWGGYSIAVGVTCVSNIVNAWLLEKRDKKNKELVTVVNIPQTNDQIITVINGMSKEQVQYFFDELSKAVKAKQNS